MKIINPWPDADKSRVNADLDPACFNYFFRGALAGERGPREAMICIFFKALYEACLEQKIPANFEIDNEHRIATILQGINFGGSARLEQRIAELESHIRNLESRAGFTSTDGTSSRPPLNSDKPKAGRGNGKGRIAKVRPSPTQPGAEPGDARSKA